MTPPAGATHFLSFHPSGPRRTLLTLQEEDLRLMSAEHDNRENVISGKYIRALPCPPSLPGIQTRPACEKSRSQAMSGGGGESRRQQAGGKKKKSSKKQNEILILEII